MEKPEKLKPEKVVEIFKKNGKSITLEQAEEVLAFCKVLANISIEQVLRQDLDKS